MFSLCQFPLSAPVFSTTIKTLTRLIQSLHLTKSTDEDLYLVPGTAQQLPTAPRRTMGQMQRTNFIEQYVCMYDH